MFHRNTDAEIELATTTERVCEMSSETALPLLTRRAHLPVCQTTLCRHAATKRAWREGKGFGWKRYNCAVGKCSETIQNRGGERVHFSYRTGTFPSQDGRVPVRYGRAFQAELIWKLWTFGATSLTKIKPVCRGNMTSTKVAECSSLSDLRHERSPPPIISFVRRHTQLLMLFSNRHASI